MKKIMSLILIIIVMLLTASLVFPSFAGDVTDVGQLFNTDLKSVGEGDKSSNNITKAIDAILGVVQVAGTGIAIIAISLLGIKYMLSSADDKAEIKKYLVGAIVGGILVFGGLEIAKLIAKFSGKVFKD